MAPAGAILMDGLTLLTNALGLRPRPKRKPEDEFRTQADVYSALQERCSWGLSAEDRERLRQAFLHRGVGGNEGAYWTYDTFCSLLAETGNAIPYLLEAAPLLWRYMRTWSTFPFPWDEYDDQMTWDTFLRTLALLRRGKGFLRDPGYYTTPYDRTQRRLGQSRRRGRGEKLRLVFQALATIPPETDSTSSLEDDEDLVDVLAACMNVDDSKYAYYRKDFEVAVEKLRSTRLRSKLDWKVTYRDFGALVRFAVGINARHLSLDAEAQDLVDGVCERMPPRSLANPKNLSWDTFRETVEASAPHIFDLLDTYLLHVLASIHPDRQEKPFAKVRPVRFSPWINESRPRGLRLRNVGFEQWSPLYSKPKLLLQIACLVGPRKCTSLQEDTPPAPSTAQEIHGFLEHSGSAFLLLISARKVGGEAILLGVYSSHTYNFDEVPSTVCGFVLEPEGRVLWTKRRGEVRRSLRFGGGFVLDEDCRRCEMVMGDGEQEREGFVVEGLEVWVVG